MPSLPAHGIGEASLLPDLTGIMTPSEYAALSAHESDRTGTEAEQQTGMDGLPGASFLSSLGGHAQVRDVADAGKRFAAEAIRAKRREVLEGFDLGGREAFAKDGQVIFLRDVGDQASAGVWQ